MEQPIVSIIIPVGPGHARHSAQAVASCLWQTFGAWEAIVVNDTRAALPDAAAPRVRVVDAPPPGDAQHTARAARARNLALDQARGVFVVCLDADDYLLPGALESLLRAHATHDKAYTYSAHYSVSASGQEYGLCRPRLEYDPAIYARFNLHPVTALVPTACARDVGGFDEGAPGYEDWTFYLRLAQAGYCGAFSADPTFVYRHALGLNHPIDNAGGGALMEQVRARYRNESGEITFMGCGCSGGAAAAKAAARATVAAIGAPIMAKSTTILLEYTGPGEGKQTFVVPASGRSYRAGRNVANRYLSTDNGLAPEDVDYLIGLGLFQRVPPPAAFVPAPDVTFTPAPALEQAVAADTEAESHAPKRSKK